MSYLLEDNKPNGKSSQIYHFKKPWEIKHAVGIQHKKRIEFQSRDGIANVMLTGVKNQGANAVGDYGRFVINGNPRAVDALILDINKWLLECARMYHLPF